MKWRLGIMGKTIGYVLGSGLALIMLYLFFWPVPINPVSWTPPNMPPLIGVYQENYQLAAVERLGIGTGIGPEDIAFDAQGFMYSGVADGNILRFLPGATQPEIFVNTGGRPLGLAFNARGFLIVADAFKGILAIAPDGNIEVLANEVNGEPINFADGLDIAGDGTIYFTEASRKFTQDEFMLDLYEHRPNGRLLAYDPVTKRTQVLLGNLYFANGVAVSPDQSFLLVAEMGAYRILRYWLRGPRVGEVDTFIENLPGFPDNLRSNGEDTFWVALSTGPEAREMMDAILSHPFLRKIIVRVPRAWMPKPPKSGYVLAVDMNGHVVLSLQDPTGKSYSEITTAREFSGMLYLGSSSENTIGRLPIP